jgi:hypothetical protein
MQAQWWQYRDWKFATDMNRDGAFTPADISYWAHTLFFMPGDAIIALLGPTSFGGVLHLTPASFGSAISGAISAALWVFAILYLRNLLLDCVDPTYRERERESRLARLRARREVWLR